MKTVKAYFTFGRLNPLTRGHVRIIEKLREEAQADGGIVRVYLSQTHDADRNPLTPEQKIEFAKKFFPDVEFRLSKTVFTAALEMASEGVDEGVMIVGEDRFAAFTTLLTTYAGTEALGLKTTEVKAIARAASDASASCARSAALAGDWETFRDLSPTDDVGLSHQLYAAVRNGLGVA